MVLLGVYLALFGREGFKKRTMLGTYSEVYVHAAVVVLGIEGTFYQMFLEGGTGTFLVTVELEETLGKLTVVQTVGTKHACHHSLILTLANKGRSVLAVLGHQTLVEVGEESGIRKTVEKFLFEIRGGDIIIGIKECKHVFEHTACGTGCGNKLHHTVFGVGGILVPSCKIGLLLFSSRNINAMIGHTGGTLKLEEGETGSKTCKLFVKFFF